MKKPRLRFLAGRWFCWHGEHVGFGATAVKAYWSLVMRREIAPGQATNFAAEAKTLGFVKKDLCKV